MPSALKVLRGNPGNRKINANEPKPPEGAIVRPSGLSPHAAPVWDELAPIAIAMHTLTTADVAALATLCELEATRRLASAEKNREDFRPFLVTTVPDPDGNTHTKVTEHPALRLERATASALRPYYEKFGLEPVGRARISLPKGEQKPSKWAGLIPI
jgi:phage terminase small subunit